MVLVVDGGNSTITFGIWKENWTCVWRITSHLSLEANEITKGYFQMSQKQAFDSKPDAIICATSAPRLIPIINRFAESNFAMHINYLDAESAKSLSIDYRTPHTLGADRIANAYALKELFDLPAIAIDMGTATNFDVVSADGSFVGGAIMPSPAAALFGLQRVAPHLPDIEMKLPQMAIGKDTDESLRLGVLGGYVSAIDGLVSKMKEEIGEIRTVVATGGLSEWAAPLCQSVTILSPLLTLDGLRIALRDFC